MIDIEARVIGRVLGPVVAVALLMGCASGDGDDGAAAASSAPSASSSSSASPSPSASARQVDENGFPVPERPDCAADAGGDFVPATTSEGNDVGILLIGTGTSGVVLGPQSDGDICQMLPYAEELATTYRVALYDWDEPRSEIPVLAVAALREAGVQKVVLGGASYGGAMALSQAHRVRPRLAGVLSFGGEITLPGFDGSAGIRKWRGPLLQISSKQDGYFDAENAKQLRSLHRGPETILMLPGQAHGVDLLDDPQQARVRAAVDRFLAQVLS